IVIWVPGSPIDCADTIPADSFASIAWRSNFSLIFVRTSWRRFLLSFRPWIFFASSPTTYRGSHRPISFSPSMISCSPPVSGGEQEIRDGLKEIGRWLPRYVVGELAKKIHGQ